jgi:hypothetical protein
MYLILSCILLLQILDCLIDPLIADGGGKGVETAAKNDGSPCPASAEF